MNSLSEMKKDYKPVKVQRLSEEKTQWFRDAKFGMFIHWGLYSLLGRGEWVMFNERINIREYAKLGDRFTADGFDAHSWAKTARKAGMKYMVLTTKHHDGFCLFDSRANHFNSVHSAAKRDFVAEYVNACRDEGLKVGLYYSPMDWRYPGYFFPEMYYDNALEMREQCREQLRELMTHYGKIDVLWFDGEWLAHGGIQFQGEKGWYRDKDFGLDEIYFKTNYFWESEKVIAMIRELQPDIMINNRFGWEGDFHVRERRIGDIRTGKPWDSNDCLARSWGWTADAPMLSLRECVKNLVSIIVRDGNYLLNVGPTGAGIMEPRMVKRLEQVGEWLEKYGESVYSTRGGPVQPGEWGGTTYRGNIIYVHITEWTEDTIILPGIKNKVMSYESMTAGEVEVTQTDNSIAIFVPVQSRQSLDTIIVLKLDSPVAWDGVEGVEQDIYGLADGL
jgi:alpha-L-fucosidase